MKNKDYPIYSEIGNKLYRLNTDYMTAIKCLDVINSDEYEDIDRALLVIALLYKDWEKIPESQYEKALNNAIKFLTLGKENKSKEQEEKDMDYSLDMEYIKSSFRADYKIDLDSYRNMHWNEFYNLCNGLSENCILNRVREIRTYDTSKVKDWKLKEKLEDLKEAFSLPKVYTDEEREQQRIYNEIFGIEE